MEDLYEKQKTTAGSAATFLWIGIGIYLFAVNERASFFSWQAAVYFIVGMFIAAFVLGVAAYAIQRGVAGVISRMVSYPTGGVATMIQALGMVLLVAEAIAIYFIADWVVSDLLFPA